MNKDLLMLYITYHSGFVILLLQSTTNQICVFFCTLTATLSGKNLENLVILVSGMSIRDCREAELEGITVVGKMENGTIKNNQNGVLKIP